MLAVSKLTPGQEAYYERSVAAGLDDYYAGGGESPGVWTGRGAAGLDLEGVVKEGELGRLINRRHPRTSTLLRSHPPKRQITVERIDPKTGEHFLERKTVSPVAGYDLVFSPPKSVSLLYALGDPEIRHAVNHAHLVAWQAALGYLEREACVTRKGKDGTTRERASGFVAAAYQHRTSRAQDPHLHTHVIVANLAQSPDGTCRALDGEPILKSYRLAAGYLYQAQLRFELTRTLGVEWGEPAKGMAELAGVPEGALRAFSQRRGQVLDYLERQGTSGFYAAKVAAVETRDRKEPVDLPRLRQEWRARAAEHGLGRRKLERLLGQATYRELDRRSLLAIASRLLGPTGLTEKRTTISAPEAAMAWAEAHPHGAPVERILRLAARFTSIEEVVPVVSGASPGRPARFSTSELLRCERTALAVAERGRAARTPTVSGAGVERVARGLSLGPDQVAMLRAVAASPDRVVSVVGRAGAGKTTGLRAVARAFRMEGVTTMGCAPTGVAAERLVRDAGIPSTTLHRVVAKAHRRRGLPKDCILVVDEAGMADTRTLTQALLEVERAEGKAILVGDPAQLPAVEAGGLFAAIVERQGAVELGGNRRQRDQLERRALEAIRSGDGDEYLAYAARRGRVEVADDQAEAKARLLADWWRAARDDLAGSVMIAYRRRADLNAAARTVMDRAGWLGVERLRLADAELAPGDRVVCLQNDRRLHVANGTRGAVAAVDLRERAIVLETHEGRRLHLPAAYLDAGHVRHAYALTGHKTQGLTLERAFVLASGEGSLKEWGYVAFSRARMETRLYTSAPELQSDAHPRYRAEAPEPLDRLAEALACSAAEELALDARGDPSSRAGSGSPVALDREAIMSQGPALVQRRLGAEKQRAEEVRRLRASERELAGLGLIARVRRGPALREEVAERQEAVARVDRELDDIEREIQAFRQRVATLSAARERPPRPIVRARSRQLELGLDL
jgi:conjugative relaxase-like TrwC/TraI family protein